MSGYVCYAKYHISFKYIGIYGGIFMEFIRVTNENIEKEHICCAISNNHDIQVSSKKTWLKERFDEGLIFLKSKQRGKCFIEYIPAENAWNPIDAEGYMYFDCLWLAGSFKGHGYSTELLNACVGDSKSVITTLSLSTGTTLEASPICSAR